MWLCLAAPVVHLLLAAAPYLGRPLLVCVLCLVSARVVVHCPMTLNIGDVFLGKTQLECHGFVEAPSTCLEMAQGPHPLPRESRGSHF